MSETRYAIMVCVFFVLALGFVGWYEHCEQPAPQPSVEQMMIMADREAEAYIALRVKGLK